MAHDPKTGATVPNPAPTITVADKGINPQPAGWPKLDNKPQPAGWPPVNPPKKGT